MNPLITRLGRATVASLLLLLVAGVAVAAAADVGHKDFADTGGSAVTGSKPESKLWYNAGSWWGALQPSTGGGLVIYKLDSGDNWVSTGVQIDSRSSNHLRADTLWDGTKLYVASQIQSDTGATGSGSAYEARLYRFSYNGGTYSLDNGFPAIIRSGLHSETLVIAKDSTGMLWATWTQPSGSNRLVYTNHTQPGNDASWSTPAVLPVGNQPIGVTTDADDISTIIAFTVGGEHRIGVYWSNQADAKDYFAWRVDGTLDTTVWTGEVALSGASQPDDHMNVKTDASGQVYIAVKTSLTGANPLIKLLRRTSGGSWSNFVVGIDNVGSNTRPILELEEKGSGNILHVYMTGARTSGGSGQSGGDIFEKTSPVSNISFASGLGTTVIRDDASAKMNNATSTKQNVNSTTGVVVEAFNDTTDFYWHHHDTLGAGPPKDPQAAFTQDKTSGTQPVAVQFTNQSTGTPTLTYAWDFGDPGSGGSNTSTLTNPSHTYNNAGTYTVKLTTTNGNSQSDTLTQTNLITVSAPSSTITVTPDADARVFSGSAGTNYGTDAVLRTREENPVATNTYRTYLRFNVTGLTGSVTGVKLRLYANTGSSNIQSVYATTTNPNWIESGTGSITWTNAPAIGSTLWGSSSVPTTGAYNEIVLSPTAITGNGLVTFAVKSSGTTSAYFSSKEGANAPQLVITQTTGPTNTQPTASATSATTNEDTAATVALSGGDAETCELGFAIVTPPSHGTLQPIVPVACAAGSPNTDTASVIYTPAANYSGTDSFTYKTSDPSLDSTPATATLTVSPVNDAPVAVDTSAATTVNTPTPVTMRGSDVDTCELASFTVVTPPANGTLTLPTDNACVAGSPNTDTQTITYTPNNNYTGGDSFTYKVNDGSLDSATTATATLTVTASNTVPTADDKSPSVLEDQAHSIIISGGDAETCDLTFSIVSPPSHGNLGSIAGNTCAGSGPFTDSASVTYTPAANYNGPDSFTYKVNDGTSDSSAATVSVTVVAVNDQPTADAVSVSTVQNTAKGVTLTGHDVEDCNLTFTITGNPTHGTLGSIGANVCAAGSPNTDTGSVTYTPTSGYTGSDSFTYKVTDGSAQDSTDATVSITVTGGSPTTITLNPVADAQVNSATASVDKNFGTTNPMRTREDPTTPNTYRPYYQFNVPTFSGTVQSVKLRLYVTTASSAMTQSVYLVGNGWTETGLTWNNAPALPGSSIGSGIAGTANAYVEFTLTTPITSNSSISFALKSSGTTSVYFSSREDATNKPQLVIVYQ